MVQRVLYNKLSLVERVQVKNLGEMFDDTYIDTIKILVTMLLLEKEEG